MMHIFNGRPHPRSVSCELRGQDPKKVFYTMCGQRLIESKEEHHTQNPNESDCFLCRRVVAKK